MKLSNAAAKAAKPAEKPYKLADGGGLYLEVFPNGSKLWRLKYRRPGGKETRVSLGPFPSTSIVDARAKREQLKKQRRDGVDPATERRTERARRRYADANSFEAVAHEWFGKIAKTVTPDYLKKMKRRFERDLFPYIGKRPIGEVEAPELLTALQRIEARGAIETAHRARGECGALFRYAIATGRAKHDVSADLRGPSANAPAWVSELCRTPSLHWRRPAC